MIITGIALQNFRVHKNYFLQFTKQTTVIVGANAAGKTSIIEAIGLLATGNSFRAGKIEEMVAFESELARVKGVVVQDVAPLTPQNSQQDSQQDSEQNSQQNSDSNTIEVILTRGIVGGRRTQSRLFNVNGVSRRKKDAAGKFYAVVFRPEDMRMIEGSPSRRRNYLDSVLSCLYIEYEAALKNYEQTLKRRNKLLFQIKEGKQPKTVLQYWNLSLVKYGSLLQKYRQEFLETFRNVSFALDFSVEYDASVISQERLDHYAQKEFLVGHTLIGPHKDDLIVYLHPKQQSEKVRLVEKLRIDAFGSRGQQRLAVLWLKFCELEYVKQKASLPTILLLDDILSELDDNSKALALSVVAQYQTVITTTEESVLEDIQAVVKSDKMGIIKLT